MTDVQAQIRIECERLLKDINAWMGEPSPSIHRDMQRAILLLDRSRELLALLPIHGDERGRTAEDVGANGQAEVTPMSATREGQIADSDVGREDIEK